MLRRIKKDFVVQRFRHIGRMRGVGENVVPFHKKDPRIGENQNAFRHRFMQFA